MKTRDHQMSDRLEALEQQVRRMRIVTRVLILSVVGAGLLGAAANNNNFSGSVTIDGDLKVKGKTETGTLQVGGGGTAIEMKKDEIYMGYGGVQSNGRRKEGIKLIINGDNGNRGDIFVRDSNSGSPKHVH